ncbi:MAG: hypothetical protein NTV57_00505 [Cyanobacteria bacterium]|nr:hypothetical protein [Cyanobacteriota bacterium]
MKRLLLLSIGCSACLITGATTGAKADVSATINAAGKVPSACFVTGTSLPLEMSGPNDLSATGATVMQSSGPAIFALDTVSISGPELAMAGGLSATVLLKSSQGELTASTSSGEKLEVKEFLSDEKTSATVSVASKTGVLPAGIYELKTTLTCVSN